MLLGTWGDVLKSETSLDYFNKILRTIDALHSNNICIYPPRNQMFEAFMLTDYSNLKVVILGQDPYHGNNQAHGLAFSVASKSPQPPSLKNIFKELHNDVKCKLPTSQGNLTHWATQGVLLLNTSLSVEAGKPLSHKKLNWEQFTDSVIYKLNNYSRPLVFLLWGKHASNKRTLITNTNHLILTAPHPSPLSAYKGFFGCKHFSKANQFLEKHQIDPIDWAIAD